MNYADLNPYEKNTFNEIDFIILRYKREDKLKILESLVNKYREVKQ